MSRPVSIIAAGMVTGNGNSAAATCAAMRAGVRGVGDSKLWDYHGGDYLKVGRPVFKQWWEGRDMLAALVAPAIEECALVAQKAFRVPADDVPIILVVAPRDRPLRWPDFDREVPDDLIHALGRKFARGSGVIAEGRTGFVRALEHAGALFDRGESPVCIIAGMESFLRQKLVDHYMLGENRILSGQNSNGFTLGEAGAAVLVAPAHMHRGPELVITGMGKTHDPSGAGGNEKHAAKGDGLTLAIRQALAGARIDHGALDLRISDANGEHWKFKETTFATLRLARPRPPGVPPYRFSVLDHWHPCTFIGEIGAAVGPIMLGWALHAGQKRYLHGPRVLIHAAEDNGDRAALVAEYRSNDRRN